MINILKVYEVLKGPYKKEGTWSLDIRTEAGEPTEDTTVTITFDSDDLANLFKKSIQEDLPDLISARMQELSEELFSLQTMVDSGELYWQLGSFDEDENDEDDSPSSRPRNKYLN